MNGRVSNGLTISLEIKLSPFQKLQGVVRANVFLVKLDTCDRLSRHWLERVAFLLLSLVLKEMLSQGQVLNFDLFDIIFVGLHAVVKSLLKLDWPLMLLLQEVRHQNMLGQSTCSLLTNTSSCPVLRLLSVTYFRLYGLKLI